MDINTNNRVQGLESTQKVSGLKGEKEYTAGQQTNQTEENPDYRISMSDTSKKVVNELTHSQAASLDTENVDLSEEEALQLARHTTEKLSKTHAPISNQAMLKAVDLFT